MKQVTVTIYKNTSKGAAVATVLQELAKKEKNIEVITEGITLENHKNPPTTQKVVITETTELTKAVIELLSGLTQGVGYTTKTDPVKSNLEQVREAFDVQKMWDE